jgi:hypothetical protein
MTDCAKLARFSTWGFFREAAAQTTSSGSELHRAATIAALGRDPAGLKFAAIAARLPAPNRARLLALIGVCV